MKRAEVWWAQLDERRPTVLISRQEAYAVRATVLTVPVSTTIRGFATEVRLGRARGLPKTCVANCDVIEAVPKTDLIERAGALKGAKLEELDAALAFALGLSRPA
jgi:mRNA interferase MazF